MAQQKIASNELEFSSGVFPITGGLSVAAGSNTAPSITTAGDTNTGIFFPAADTIAFAEGGVESMRIDSSGNLGIGTNNTVNSKLYVTNPNVAQLVIGYNNTGVNYIDADTNVFRTSNATETMRIGSNGNIGIGTTSTSGGRLQVSGVNSAIVALASNGAIALRDANANAATNAVDVHIRPSSGKSGYITFTEDAVADRFAIGIENGVAALLFKSGQYNGTERMRIDSSGNVGIGTNNPLTKLHLQDNSAVYIQLTDSGDGASRIGQNGTALTFGNDASNGTTERMRIDSSGRIAIGSTTVDAYAQVRIQNNLGAATGNPWENAQLTVNSNATTAQGVGAVISLEGNYDTGTSPANYAWIKGAKTNGTLGSATGDLILGARGGNIRFSNDNTNSGLSTERMRIDSSGNVGIGTSSPSALLQVAGSSIFSDSMQIFNNPTSSAQGILFRNTFNVGASIFSMGAATTNGIIAFVGGNGTQGAITGNGAGISYTSASDYRLKENVAPMTNALGVVAQLKPCTYTWKCDGSAGQGFIAHELQEIISEAVTGTKDEVDEEGNIVPQGVDTSFLVATLTAAIQELKAEFDEYKRTHP